MTFANQVSAVPSAVAALRAELHAKADCQKLGLAQEFFAVILREIGEKFLPASNNEAGVRAFFLRLRLEERALARAGPAAHEAAWELFLPRYREKLSQSAVRIAREVSAARELA